MVPCLGSVRGAVTETGGCQLGGAVTGVGCRDRGGGLELVDGGGGGWRELGVPWPGSSGGAATRVGGL